MRTWACFVFVTALVMGCGGGGGSSGGGSSGGGTPDFVNGDTIDTVTSHWATNPCIATSGRIAFAANGLGEYVDGFSQGKRLFRWSQPNPSTIVMTYVISPCPICMASITQVSGGLSAGQMLGQGWRGDGHTSGPCTFTIVGGPIP